MSQEEKQEKLSTEEKIKEAARIVFTKKGYAATKTRDIAEQAGLNLALLNYYFRSKDKLFEIIMLEKIQELFSFSIAPVFNDRDTSVEEKIDLIAERYINLLLKNPDLPLFVLSEIRNNPERFIENIQMTQHILKSYFFKQLMEKRSDMNPIQLFISFLGMLVFPFIARPVFNASGVADSKAFERLMEERKRLVPQWMKMIIEQA